MLTSVLNLLVKMIKVNYMATEYEIGKDGKVKEVREIPSPPPTKEERLTWIEQKPKGK